VPVDVSGSSSCSAQFNPLHMSPRYLLDSGTGQEVLVKRMALSHTGIESSPSHSHLLTGPSQFSPKVSGLLLRNIVPRSGLDVMILCVLFIGRVPAHNWLYKCVCALLDIGNAYHKYSISQI
jgi:hypothetical protein